MRKGAVLLAGLGAALLVGVGSAGTSPPTPKGLLLWNTLGSAYAMTHSLAGPNLVMFNCRNRRMPHFGPRCSIDIRGKLAFVKGPGGAPAATIGGGPYFSEARVHTAVLTRSLLNPEHGAVEAWYRQTKDPVPYVDNPHRIFHGPYGLAGPDDVMLFAQDRVDSGNPRLHFVVSFTGNSPTAPVVWARSLDDHGIGYPISKLNGQWIHVAGVWDRKGIAGTTDTVRLYVNGKVVAASKSKRWGRTPCGGHRHRRRCFFDVVGCNDTCAGTFAVAGLKLWNYARTDFP
jgi:Concanavalin A-like lectin/glucanases superfamily